MNDMLSALRPALRAMLMLALAALLGVSAPAALAQNSLPQQQAEPGALPGPADEAPSLRFEHLGLADGLAQKSVHALMQDSAGFVWIGTQGGLHRYDGRSFEVFAPQPFDTTSLSSGWVMGMDEAGDGDLWVATHGGGLNRLDPATGRATRYQHRPGDSTSLASDRTWDVVETSAGGVWVATDGAGVSRLDPATGRFTRYRHEPGDSTSLSNDVVLRVSEDPEGHVWAGTANGVSRIDPATGETERFLHVPGGSASPDGPNNVPGTYFPADEPGVAWLATGNGLVRLNYETGERERFLVAPNSGGGGMDPRNVLRKVTPDPQNPAILWATGPDTGLVRFDTRSGQFTAYRHNPQDPNSLSSNNAEALLGDRSGTMWVGTRSDGLNKFNPGAVDFAHLRHDPDNPQSLAPGYAWDLYEDAAGTLWAGTAATRAENHLTRFDGRTGRVTRYRAEVGNPNAIQQGQVSGFAEGPAGALWVGHSFPSGGLSRIDSATGRVTRFSPQDAGPNGTRGSFLALLPTAADPGVLWAGSFGGLSRFDTRTGRFTRVPFGAGLPDQAIVAALHQDAAGTLWAGTLSQGLLRLGANADTLRVAAAHDPADTTSISSNAVSVIHERAAELGVLWLGTMGGGLSRYDTETGEATTYLKEDGLPNNTIYGILEDEAGTLWMSTNNGISNFDPETETFENYGLEDGLMALEYNGPGAHTKGQGGVLYFGSAEGITAFRPEAMKVNQTPPQVALTGLALFNQPVTAGATDSPLDKPLAETKEISLAHDQNQLTFRFAALHFENPEKNEYAYRLDGYDEDWVQAGMRAEATYTNLPPGDYRFEVKAANSDGVWSEKTAGVALSIAPPWWRTWWAYGVYALILCAGIFAVDRFQRRRLVAREREKAQARELEQARETEKAYRETEKAYNQLDASHQELKRTQDQLVQQEKLASLGALTAGIAHEIKNPLNFVTNFSALSTELADELAAAAEEGDLEEIQYLTGDLKTNAAMIEKHGRRADGIVRSMMAHARTGSGEREAADLNALVEEYVDLAYHGKRASTPGFNAEIERDLGAGVGAVEMVPQEIGRVVLNLVGNAFDATMEHAAAVNGEYAPRVAVSTRRTGGSVEIRVADNGPGIPADVREKLFEPFFTTKDTGKGTGLGLSMSYDIITQGHGGTLDVESTPGEGAAFVITLPQEAEASGQARGAAQTGSSAGRQASSFPTKNDGALP